VPQVDNALVSERNQPFNVISYNRTAARNKFLSDSRQPHLQPDIRLDDAIVQVTRNALPLHLGSVRGEPINKPHIVDDGHGMLDDV
jgi:hypothetical protein